MARSRLVGRDAVGGNPARWPEEVTEALPTGKSLLHTGDHFGVHASTLRTHLLTAGVEMREPGFGGGRNGLPII